MARHLRNSRNNRSRTGSNEAETRSGRGRRPATEDERKDRVIQTRVPKDLENTLKDAAERKRMTVSHLIRNVLEDTFKLVDGIVADSSALVENVARDARKLAATARGESLKSEPAGNGQPASVAQEKPVEKENPVENRAGQERAPDLTDSALTDSATPDTAAENPLDAVDAWQDVIVNRPGECAGCGVALGRGKRAFRGISTQPGAPAIWLCPTCIEAM